MYSKLYRNKGSLFFSSAPLDWGEQIVLVTGGTLFCRQIIRPDPSHFLGASGIGKLLANTLAVRNVTVVVLDINPIITENCKHTP